MIPPAFALYDPDNDSDPMGYSEDESDSSGEPLVAEPVVDGEPLVAEPVVAVAAGAGSFSSDSSSDSDTG